MTFNRKHLRRLAALLMALALGIGCVNVFPPVLSNAFAEEVQVEDVVQESEPEPEPEAPSVEEEPAPEEPVAEEPAAEEEPSEPEKDAAEEPEEEPQTPEEEPKGEDGEQKDGDQTDPSDPSGEADGNLTDETVPEDETNEGEQEALPLTVEASAADYAVVGEGAWHVENRIQGGTAPYNIQHQIRLWSDLAHEESVTMDEPAGEGTALEFTYSPEQYGEYTYTVAVTDAEGTTASSSCSALVADRSTESEDAWKRKAEQFDHTEDPCADFIDIVKGQVGYRESVSNFILSDGEIKGYTHYGDWYGSAWADWNALFISYCADCANLSKFPVAAAAADMRSALRSRLADEDYQPQQGDLVFLRNADGEEHVAMFLSGDDSVIRVIEGDVENSVAKLEYDLRNEECLGYVPLASFGDAQDDAQNADTQYDITITTYENAESLAITVSAETTDVELGKAITWEANATGGAGDYTYYFYVYKNAWDLMTKSTQYSSENTFSYTPTEVGKYRIAAYVKCTGSNPVNAYSDYVTVSKPEQAELTATVTPDAETVQVGSKITWTVTAQGGEVTEAKPYTYYYYVYKDRWNEQQRAEAYTTNNTIEFTPTDSGKYRVVVYVKDASGKMISVSHEYVEAKYDELTATVTANAETVQVGDKITWTVTAQGGKVTEAQSYTYYYYVYKDRWNEQQRAEAYTTNNTIEFTPADSGKYRVVVYVKDASGKMISVSHEYVEAKYAELTATVTADAETVQVGDKITWTVTAQGGKATEAKPYTYYYYVYKDRWNEQQRAEAYTTNNTIEFTPADSGKYRVVVYVKDAEGKVISASHEYVEAKYAELTATVTADADTVNVGSKITWTVTAQGGKVTEAKPYTYYYYVYKDRWNEQQRAEAYTTNNTIEFTPTDSGNYRVVVYVKDAEGKVISASHEYVEAKYAPLSVEVSVDKSEIALGESVTWTFAAQGGKATAEKPYTYYYYIYQSEWTLQQKSEAYAESNSVTFTPSQTGVYRINVYVKDANGALAHMMSQYITVTANTKIEWVSASQTGYDTATLEWSAIDGAEEYDVLYSDALEGAYTKVVTVTGETKAVVPSLNQGTYYFKVQAFAGQGEARVEKSELSEAKIVVIGEWIENEGDFTFKRNAANDGIIVVSYTGNASEVTIPDSFDTMPVIEIGDDAFADNSTITTVHVPETVEVIGMRAFKNCVNLKEMD